MLNNQQKFIIKKKSGEISIKTKPQVLGSDILLVQNSLIKSIWGLTSGGPETVDAIKDPKTKYFRSIFTKALIESLDKDSENSLFIDTEIYNLEALFSKINENMKFTTNSPRFQLPGFGSFTYVNSLNLSERSIPVFSSSFEHLKKQITKKIFLQRKSQISQLVINIDPIKISLKKLQIEFKEFYDQLKMESIDILNEQRKKQLLSQSYINCQFFIHKQASEENSDQLNNSFENQKKYFFDENNSDQIKEKKEIIHLKEFWNKLDRKIEKIILFGRYGIGKVKKK